MSKLMKCDKCGATSKLDCNDVSWLALGVYDGRGDRVDIMWDICPACLPLVNAFFTYSDMGSR